jgi:hypothetical protein
MDTFYVFGDSHSLCFDGICKKVHAFHASSAKGLSNINSLSQTNEKICLELNNINILEKNIPNILFFFGKVDMDFTLNYKYNADPNMNFNDYIINIVNLYVNFIKKNAVNKNIYICELPIPHMNDDNLLKRINNENSMKNINNYLSDANKFDIIHINKVFNYDKRLNFYLLFNQELKKLCENNSFKLLEINKYFINDKKEYKIPTKYINNDNLDHHLNNVIYELFMKDYDSKYNTNK